MRALNLLSPLVFLLVASAAQAQAAFLVVNPEDPGAAYEARYSQAVLISVLLSDDEGPVAGEQVVIEVILDGEEEGVTLLPQPTDGAGRATARLTLVNGRHGGATFPAAEPTEDSPGQRYRVVARYAGDLEADDPACSSDAGVPADGGPGGLCPATAEAELFVIPETVAIELEPGNRVELGGSLQLIATLKDPNGDAAVGGTAIDGDEDKPVEGASISFFFDLDGNERPSLDELLGRDDTDENGFATFTFVADPAIFPAGEFEQGLQVQFGGDDRYAVAGAAGRVTIDPGAPFPERCVIEVVTEPNAEGNYVADGTSRITLRGILVDEGNNILGVDAPDYTVTFTSDEVTVLEDAAVRDPVTGHYTQQVRVPDREGTATVTIVVDGEEGASLDIPFVARGCACQTSTGRPGFFGAAALLTLAFFVRTRRRW